MAFPESFTLELLNRTDIVDIVDKRVPLKKKGSEYSANCPFHQEKTPSFTVSPSKQFYHCFGCGAHGNAISFLIEHDGLTFLDAINYLASSVGLEVPKSNFQSPEKKQQSSNLLEALNIANIYYKRQLKKSSLAINYLKDRGLSGKTAKDFSIGYAPDGYENLKSTFKNYQDETLIKAGLTDKSDNGKYYDRFRGRIMFPIYNTKGDVIGFGGRVIDSEKTPKYYNSPETPLFQKKYELYGLLTSRKAIHDEGYAIVVEGYMDVVGLAQFDIRNVVATLGTATTEFHIQKLIRYTSEIVFCFDGDRAGKSAAWKAMNNSLSSITDSVQLKFLFLPSKHDPDSYVREKSAKDFQNLARQALPLTEYVIKYLTTDNDLVSQESKVKFLNNIEPIIMQINAPKFSLLFKKRIAELVNLDMSEINQVIGKVNKQKLPTRQKVNNKIQRKILMSSTRKFSLLIILNPGLAKKEDLHMFQSDLHEAKLANAIIEISLKDGEYNMASIFHFLSNRFGEKVVEELNSQLATVGEMNYELEIDALRTNLKNKQSAIEKKNTLNQIEKKGNTSLLSDEDKDFLRNITKR